MEAGSRRVKEITEADSPPRWRGSAEGAVPGRPEPRAQRPAPAGPGGRSGRPARPGARCAGRGSSTAAGRPVDAEEIAQLPGSAVDLPRGQRPQTPEAEILDAEGREDAAVNHRLAQSATAALAASRQVTHEPAREAVPCAGGVDRPFDRVRGDREVASLREERRAVLPPLDHEKTQAERQQAAG